MKKFSSFVTLALLVMSMLTATSCKKNVIQPASASQQNKSTVAPASGTPASSGSSSGQPSSCPHHNGGDHIG